MRRPPIFALYCAIILLVFGFAKYEGWALFGSRSQAAASRGGGNYSSGMSGSHK